MLTKSDKKWAEEKFVTKDDLRSELKKYATKDDLKSELKKYATKDDLTVSQVRLGVEFDKKIDDLREDMGGKHNQVMTVLDKLLAEVVKGREHDLVVDFQIEKLNKAVFSPKTNN